MIESVTNIKVHDIGIAQGYRGCPRNAETVCVAVPCIDGPWGGIFDVHLLFIYIQRPLNILANYTDYIWNDISDYV